MSAEYDTLRLRAERDHLAVEVRDIREQLMLASSLLIDTENRERLKLEG